MATLKCRYQEGTTKICFITDGISDIRVNGNSIGITTTYNVDSTDIVEFDINYLEDTGSYGKNLLRGINVTSVEFGLGFNYVGANICSGCTYLETVKFSSSVIKIGAGAFSNCTNLTNIDFTEATNLLSISTGAFTGCSALLTVDLPNTLNNIGGNAFQSCTSLKRVSLGTDIRLINTQAFYYCSSLEEISIKSLNCTIGESVFTGVKEGCTVYYPTGSNYSSWSNQYSDMNFVENGYSEYIDRLVLKCKYKNNSPIYNSSYNNFYDVKVNGVSIDNPDNYYTTSEDEIVELYLRGTIITDNSFNNCDGLVSVTIPDGVTEIGRLVFNYCESLTEINIPDSVILIGYRAFLGCSALTEMYIPDSVISIGDGCFSNCSSLIGIVIGSGCTYLGTNALKSTSSLRAIHIKSESCDLGESPFIYTNTNGTLYYPTGSDYSSWLNTDEYYLGYYGWNGVEVGDNFELKIFEIDTVVLDKVPVEGAVTTVGYIKFNIDSIVINNDSDWITITDNGLSFTVTVTENTGFERTEQVVFNADGIQQTLTINQEGATDTPVDPENGTFELEFENLVLPDTASSNVAVNYTYSGVTSFDITNPDWITVRGDVTGVENQGRFIISTQANTGAERTGTVIFTAQPSGIRQILTITQKASGSSWNGISADVKYVTFDYLGGTNTIEVTFGGGGTTGCFSPLPWVKVERIEQVSTDPVVERYRIICEENDTYLDRAGNIIFSDDIYEFQFPVAQDGKESEGISDPKVKSMTYILNVAYDAENESAISPLSVLQCGYRGVVYNKPTVSDDWIILGNGSVVNDPSGEWDSLVEYPISFSEEYPYDETGTIVFSGTDNSGNTLSSTCYINYSTPFGYDDSETAVFELAGDSITVRQGGVSMGILPFGDWDSFKTIDYVVLDEVPDWVTFDFSHNGPYNDEYLKFDIPANEGAERIGTVKFTAYPGGVVQTFTITQKAYGDDWEPITAEKSSLSFDSTGKPEQVINATYYPYWDRVTFGTYDYQWVNRKTEQSNGFANCTVDCVKNDGDSRTGLIEISSNWADDYRIEIPIYQNGIEISAFTQSIKVNADGTPEIASLSSVRCGYSGITVNEPTTDSDWIVLGKGQQASGTFVGFETVMDYPISFLNNDTLLERTGTVTFSGTNSNGTVYTSTLTVTQVAGSEESEDIPEYPVNTDTETFAPIWKDVEYVFGGVDVTYGIYVEKFYIENREVISYDELLFKGRAYARPNETVIKVNINKICQNYMPDIVLKLDDTVVDMSHSYETFKLKNENGTLLHTYHFVNDWTYKPLVLGIKTNPIVPYIALGQRLFFSALAQGEKEIKWGMRYYDGTEDYDNIKTLENDMSTLIVPSSRQLGVSKFYFGKNIYPVLPKCKCKYVLYYQNPYGGYSWFPITGRVIRRDRLETYTVTQNYNNNTTDFGKRRYLSTININYEINTQWLSQEQSDRMWELIESNQVWLHNLDDNEIMPVIITDTDVEHKQKTLNGRMLSYRINVELSHLRERI